MFLSSSRVERYIIWPQKGQVESLTSGQGHDLTQTYHDAYYSICLDKTNQSNLFWSLYVVSIKKLLR